MARKKSFRPAIKPAETIDELRKSVESELNRLSTQLGSQDFFGDTAANTYRLTRLGNPAAEHDAVNLKTMRKAIEEAIAKLYAQLHRPDLSRAYNYNDEEFSIIPGGFVINGLDMTKSFNFDTDIFGNAVDFTVLAGGIGTDEIAAGAVTTLKLTTQEINLGYGGNDMPVRLRIYDTSNNPIGWIGDDSINHGGDTDYVGAWFKRLLVGGDGTLNTAGMFADANGNVVAKSLWIYDALGTTGWIGSRQTSGPDPQTYYGGFFKELYVGGSWSETDDYGPLDAPLYVDNSGDLFITDGTITLNYTSGAVLEMNETDGFQYTGNDSQVANLTDNGLTFYGGSVGAAGYGRYDTDRMQTIYGIGGSLSPVGVSIESYNGYGDVHVTNNFGTTTMKMHGGTTTNAAGLQIYTQGGIADTPIANYGSLSARSDKDLYWYDQGSTSWRRLAYADELGGSVAFLDLTDTPGSYTSNYWVKVNAGGTALEFVTAPTASPAGSDTYVQYNNSGSMGAESSFTYNDSTNALWVSGLVTAGGGLTAGNDVNITTGQYEINGTPVITSARIGIFESIQVDSFEVFNSTGVGNFNGAKINGTEVINTSRKAFFSGGLDIGGTTRIDSNGKFSMYFYDQASQPTIGAGEVSLWIDSDDSNRTYLITNNGYSTIKIELT